MSDKEKGLYEKYSVERYDGKPVAWALVLEDKDPLAIPALKAYAAAAKEAGYEKRAADITSKLSCIQVESDLEMIGRIFPEFAVTVPQSIRINRSRCGAADLSECRYYVMHRKIGKWAAENHCAFRVCAEHLSLTALGNVETIKELARQ